MGFIELLLIGVGLSMDAFAAAVCKGLGMRRVNRPRALAIALFFGGFQAMMPALGWLIGRGFAQMIEPLDHWVAFCLLSIIGAKMVKDGLGEPEAMPEDCFQLGEVVVLALATSIDALAVGVTFAFLQVSILSASLLIGLTTFSLSLAGVYVGSRFGGRLGSRAEAFGGVILILMGIKILVEHLAAG